MTKLPVNIGLLSKEDRLRLIEELWDSLDPEQDIYLTSVQRTELRSRSQALRESKLTTASIDDVLNAIRSGHVPD